MLKTSHSVTPADSTRSYTEKARLEPTSVPNTTPDLAADCSPLQYDSFISLIKYHEWIIFRQQWTCKCEFLKVDFSQFRLLLVWCIKAIVLTNDIKLNENIKLSYVVRL